MYGRVINPTRDQRTDMPEPLVAHAPRRNTIRRDHKEIGTQVDGVIYQAAAAIVAAEDTSLAQVWRDALTHLYNTGWFELDYPRDA